MALDPITLDQFRSRLGTEIGVSDWILIDQARIDGFAGDTLDHQYIHVDPEKAKASPFGGTIAHGFLSLSLLSAMSFDAVPPLAGAQMGVNYGFNTIRFLSHVPSGGKVRGRFVLRDLIEKAAGIQFVYDVTVEIEGVEKPALVAQWLTLAA